MRVQRLDTRLEQQVLVPPGRTGPGVAEDERGRSKAGGDCHGAGVAASEQRLIGRRQLGARGTAAVAGACKGPAAVVVLRGHTGCWCDGGAAP